MTFVIKSMDEFQEVFQEAAPAATIEEPKVQSLPDRIVDADNPAIALHIRNPLEESDVAEMLQILGTTLAEFNPLDYPVIEYEYLKPFKLYEAWDWECALVSSRVFKVAVLGALLVRHKRGKNDIRN